MPLKKENVTLGTNKQNEADLSSRYFRTFYFPQSNNPFSLSQLLNPKPTGEESANLKTSNIEKEKNLKWNSEAFSRGFENTGAGAVGTGKRTLTFFTSSVREMKNLIRMSAFYLSDRIFLSLKT